MPQITYDEKGNAYYQGDMMQVSGRQQYSPWIITPEMQEALNQKIAEQRAAEAQAKKAPAKKAAPAQKKEVAVAENNSFSGTGDKEAPSVSGQRQPGGFNLGVAPVSRPSETVVPSSGITGLVSNLDDGNAAMQMASEGATSQDTAEAKSIVADEKKSAEVQQKNPNDMTLPEKMAMIAMAIAPAIAGYALHGEKGAYIGGAAGMKGVHETATLLEKEQESEKERQGDLEKAKSSKGSAGAIKTVVSDTGEIVELKRDASGNAVPVGTGVFAPPKVVINALQQPVQVPYRKAGEAPVPVQQAPTGGYETSQRPVPAPAGVAKTLPKETKREPMVDDIADRYKRVTGQEEPRLEALRGNTARSMDGQLPGETADQTKYRRQWFEDTMKALYVLERDKSKAKTEKERQDAQNKFNLKRDKLAAGYRGENQLEAIAARGEEQRKTAKFKSALLGVSAAKDERTIRENNKKYSDQTKDLYTKLLNVDSFKNANDAPSIAALFNSYMKLVQQDESVVRDSDVALVKSFMPWLDNVEGFTEKIKNNPGMAKQVRDQIVSASGLLAESRMVQQMKMNNASYDKAKQLGADSRKVVDQTIESTVKDWAETHVPVASTADQAAKIPAGRPFRHPGHPGKVLIRRQNGEVKVYETP